VNFYVKLAIAAVIIGGLFAFLWKQGYLLRLTAYVEATREELKKCSWPTRDELWQSTVLIFIVMASLGVFTVGADFIILKLVRVLMGGASN
jgi:preprotein translocase subunit SecE